MRIWKSFSSDHSAKLRIIGTFKTAADAQDAANLFNALLAVEDKSKGGNFSNELMEVLKNYILPRASTGKTLPQPIVPPEPSTTY